jgi:putative membrane protein
MTRALAVPGLLAGTVIGLEVAYPLTGGHRRDVLTVVTVATFFLASTTHALVRRGLGWTFVFVVITAGAGLAAEAVGTATGVPFGHYAYADSLGAKALGVPVVIPLAWSMMAYPCLLAGQALAATRPAAAAIGGWGLASWDLFLDPQMVQAGHWHWTHVTSALPGAPDVPVSNYLGWLAVALVLMAALQLLPRAGGDDRVPAALLLWTYASSVLANAVFFDRPVTAVVGGVGMGVVVVPFAVTLLRERSPR